MKILLFSDIHIHQQRCIDLVEKSKQADLLIGAGDYGSVRRGVKKTINWLKEIDKPTILVPGNSESDDELRAACKIWKSAVVLHGESYEWNGYQFYGIGGGIPVTPFGAWSFDFTEEEGAKMLQNCPKNAILISHSPPFGILDVNGSNEHCGSKSLLKTIDEKKPKLVVCGHVHESNGKKEKYNSIDIINVGPKGMLYKLD